MFPSCQVAAMKRFLLCLASLAFAASSAHAALTDSDKQAVKVKLTQNTGAEYVASVESGSQRFRFATLMTEYANGMPADVAKRDAGVWKGDYLFVRQQCGSPIEWRCTVDQVFTRDAGKLVHLGAIESRACKELGCGFDPATGVFLDIYDGQQTNPVTGQMDSPPIRIARRVVAGQLQTDLDASWQLNQDMYRKSVACLEQTGAKGFDVPCENNLIPWTALVFASKLTHYTGRDAERAKVFDTLAAGYCAKSADPQCAKRVAGLKDHSSRFARGDSPKFNPFPVVAVAAGTEAANTAQKFDAPKSIPLKGAAPIALKPAS